MVDMQLTKISDLISLNHKLIPKQLALAFGIGTGEELHDSNKRDLVAGGTDDRVAGQNETPKRLSGKRQRTADEDKDDRRTTSAAQRGVQHTSTQCTSLAQQPITSQPVSGARPTQMPVNLQQQDAAAMAHAAASMQAAALVQQAAASMQAVPSQAAAAAASTPAIQSHSGVSGGYPPTTAAGGHAMLNAYRGFPAAAVGTAYPFSGHPLMPYMAASHQAMATMSNMSGSLGCAPMSMYSGGPVDYQSMQRQDEEAEDNQARALKRPRLVWTPQLHKLFEEAVQKLGVDKAVPKTIMQLMKVEGLTRENVASHLQKYRLSLKKGTDTDGKGSGGNTSAEGGTGEGAGSDKAGNAAATSTAAATEGVSPRDGSGGSTAADGSSSGADGMGSTGEGGTSSSKVRIEQGTDEVQEATHETGAAADKLGTMQQICTAAADAADAAAAAAKAATAAAAVVQE